MIGLGSNRLTLARRGGMSVTQAGRGGIAWLGVRDPIWATPYSAQATAALKAQFPNYWSAISQYGFDNPTMVPYINEDPMLVYCLIDGLGVRWIHGDGASYFKNIYGNTDGYKLKTKIRRTGTASGDCVAGSTYNSGGNYWRSSLFVSNSNFNLQIYSVFGATSFTFTENQAYEIEYSTKKNYYIKIDGVTKKSGTVNFNASPAYDLTIFATYYQNRYTNAIKGIEVGNKVELYTTDMDNPAFILVPFKRSNNEVVLLDVLTASIKGDRVGSFTLIESPS